MRRCLNKHRILRSDAAIDGFDNTPDFHCTAAGVTISAGVTTPRARTGWRASSNGSDSTLPMGTPFCR